MFKQPLSAQLSNKAISFHDNAIKNATVSYFRLMLYFFYFGVLHPVACIISLATTFPGVYFIFYILPLQISALVGHLEAEYTIILGSYFTHNGSIVLCY
jgi:hypothetical protein